MAFWHKPRTKDELIDALETAIEKEGTVANVSYMYLEPGAFVDALDQIIRNALEHKTLEDSVRVGKPQ